MKTLLRGTAIITILAALSFSSTPSRAAEESGIVLRNVQMQLADFGYYAGHYDGVLGAKTQAALREFQRMNGLKVSGSPTIETLNILMHGDYRKLHPSSGHPIEATVKMNWDGRWSASHTETIPTRFAKLEIHENKHGSTRSYTVLLNGAPVMVAVNQPHILKVSHTYALTDEDAVIFTTYNADGVCTQRNFLLSLHSDGTYMPPKEIGHCSGAYQVSVTNNSLFVNFLDAHDSDVFGDRWRYGNKQLTQI